MRCDDDRSIPAANKNHLEVKDWIHTEIFKYYNEEGMKKGFKIVESGPLVRSSYHAEKHLK